MRENVCSQKEIKILELNRKQNKIENNKIKTLAKAFLESNVFDIFFAGSYEVGWRLPIKVVRNFC